MLISMVAVLPQGLLDDPFELARHPGRQLPGRRRLVLKYRARQLHMAFALEWEFTGKKLIHHDAQTKDIAAGIHLAATDLFRRHIGNGSDKHARLSVKLNSCLVF